VSVNENDYHKGVRRFGAALLACLVVGSSGGCGSSEANRAGSDRPEIVVTHAVLGALVDELVGEAADVRILVPNGTDPHDWEPSAKDIERVNRADLVVANGLDLETRLTEVLAAAEDDGVLVFRATDHIDVLDGDSHEDEVHEGGSDHASGDPHFWTDPLTVVDVIEALSEELADIGLDVSGVGLVADLEDLDTDIRTQLSGVGQRVLVTGHESLGYFARRYDFDLVGAIIPGLSTDTEATAANLAELKSAILRSGVAVIFTEVGTPDDVARAIGEETGAAVVELATHLVPEGGTYRDFMSEMASTIADALAS
jgi:zinc/manganese transport system substrate-binding protein